MNQKLSVFTYSIIAFSLQIILLKVFEYLLLFTNVTEILPLGVLGISIGTITAAAAKEKYPVDALESRALAVLAATLILLVPATLLVAHYFLVGLSILCFATLGFLVALNLIGRTFSGGYVFEILGSFSGVILVWLLLPRIGAEFLFLGCVFIVALVAGKKRAWAAFALASGLLASASFSPMLGKPLNLVYQIQKSTNESVPDGAREILRDTNGAQLLATRWSLLDRVDALGLFGRVTLFFNDRAWSSFEASDPTTFPYDPNAKSGLIMGIGAGRDIRDLKAAGVSRIVGAEISPEVVGLMRGPLYLPTGKIYDSAEVHNVDGRAFLRGSDEKFDIILSRYPDLMKGGKASHTFAENYLWTEESFREFFRHLSPDGQFIFSRSVRDGQPAQAQRFKRFLATLAAGMEKAGVDTKIHGQVFLNVPNEGYYKFLFVVKKTPFTAEEVRRLNVFHGGDIPVVVPFAEPPAPPSQLSAEAKQVFLRVQELFGGRTENWHQDPELSDPATDDRPFLEYVPEHALFSSFLMNAMLGAIFLFVILIAIMGNRLSHALRAPAPAQLHCFFSGVYFCLIETYLIRRLNFAFGNPVQNMALVLLTMLLGAAAPAALVAYSDKRQRLKWLIALSPLAAVLFFVLDPLVTARSGGLGSYAALTLLILPIGIFSSFIFPNVCRRFPEGTGLLYGLNLLGFFAGSALSLAIGLELGNQGVFLTALSITFVQACLFLGGRWERQTFSAA
jgi:hypothetical protein